jgi:hypothetical protein
VTCYNSYNIFSGAAVGRVRLLPGQKVDKWIKDNVSVTYYVITVITYFQGLQWAE